MHLGAEAVRDRLLLSSGDLEGVLLAGQVAQDAGLSASIIEEGSADNGDADGRGLLVLDGEAGLGRVAVDELDAEDLGLREAGGDGYLEVGGDGVLFNLFNAFDL